MLWTTQAGPTALKYVPLFVRRHAFLRSTLSQGAEPKWKAACASQGLLAATPCAWVFVHRGNGLVDGGQVLDGFRLLLVQGAVGLLQLECLEASLFVSHSWPVCFWAVFRMPTSAQPMARWLLHVLGFRLHSSLARPRTCLAQWHSWPGSVPFAASPSARFQTCHRRFHLLPGGTAACKSGPGQPPLDFRTCASARLGNSPRGAPQCAPVAMPAGPRPACPNKSSAVVPSAI